MRASPALGSRQIISCSFPLSLLTLPQGVFSYAWVSGDHWDRPQGWLHELGHNYYLHHATSLGCGSAYCDDSCTMGYCCTPRCFNAPHNWQVRAGWAGAGCWVRVWRMQCLACAGATAGTFPVLLGGAQCSATALSLAIQHCYPTNKFQN